MDSISDFGCRETSVGVFTPGGARPSARDNGWAKTLGSRVRALFKETSRLAGRFLANRYAILTMRWIVASVFILSAGGKLVDIGRYSVGPVLEFGILPVPLAYVFGTVLPFIEALCALGLLFGVLTRLSSFGILAMSTSFFVAKEILLLKGGDLACGCFGAIATTFVSFTIYMDPPIMIMSLAILLSPRSGRDSVSLAASSTSRFH